MCDHWLEDMMKLTGAAAEEPELPSIPGMLPEDEDEGPDLERIREAEEQTYALIEEQKKR